MPSVNPGLRAMRYPDSAMPESIIVDSYQGAANPDWIMWPSFIGEELFFANWATGGVPGVTTAEYRRSFNGSVYCTIGAPSIYIQGTWSYVVTWWRGDSRTGGIDPAVVGHTLLVTIIDPGGQPWVFNTTESTLSPGSSSTWTLSNIQQGSATPCFFPNLPGPDGVVFRRPTWLERDTPITWAMSDPVDVSS